ncbi:cytochrome bd-I ubiquinol oxidase subunit 1 apoprotein [Jezberella montanilacus]|uniref:Cytochrome bd-I ubiquinol oxidase subunit 1 apoprotein n=1 Tax=Jezberella montanilacus TaxID=323426 RepID=A0A2T0XRI8_9BURK|nr:cytochrome ubiquinol oxidase subunit I [Jezberella montanilacus]PRZ01558.1 cytochrome bd-I ubiquinol oxidase subunit 1 apoprotein [Jezberella montanilacus]
MEISALWMARAQFTLSLNFLVLFAALATALGWLLFFMRWRSIRNLDGGWQPAYRFWARIFALTLIIALGCAVPFLVELGTLWPSLLERIGNVAGPLLAASIVTFFVIKAVFLGVMLFGQKRASPLGHLFSIFMVSLGLSATVFWGLVLQSWTLTPDGATLIDGRYQVFDWVEVVFNASLGWQVLLFFSGAGVISAFLLIGVSAWQALRRPLEDGERSTFMTAYWLAILSLLVLGVAVDGNERLVAQYRPAAAAAVMGYWERTSTESTKLSTRWLGRNADGTMRGLELPDGQSPPVELLYWLARCALILISGLVFLLIVLSWQRTRKGSDASNYPTWLLRTAVWSAWAGVALWFALWNIVDISRFPYLIWGTLLQADLATETDAFTLLLGLSGMIVCYGLLTLGFVSLLRHAARFGVVPVRKPGGRS